MELNACLEKCEAMIAKGSSSFYKAFRLLPSPRKEAVFVIYAFCRLIDDAVDEERPPMSLDEIAYQFDHLEQAEGHFIWPALRWLFAHFPVSKEPFYRQMEGQRRDLAFTPYETMEQLEEYCYLVAGTVGEMLLPVLHGSPGRHVVESGISLGKAMQIVNIVRDIGEDLGRNRRYIPLSLMRKHGYTEAELHSGCINNAFRAMLGELELLARRWLAIGLRDLDDYPGESAMTIELAAQYYAAILDEVREMDYRVFTKRAVVGVLRKRSIFIAVREKHASRGAREVRPGRSVVYT